MRCCKDHFNIKYQWKVNLKSAFREMLVKIYTIIIILCYVKSGGTTN